MKIFTLLTNTVKKIAGKMSRFAAFYKTSDTTPIRKNKTVFMQTFFATVKKLFTVTFDRNILPESITTGRQPVFACCPTGTENISPDNHDKDVAHGAASFALIPTAMNRTEKKSVSGPFLLKSGIFVITLVITNLFFVQKGSAQIEAAQSGNWNATTTWVGGVVPTAGSAVQIRGAFTVTVNVTNAACASLKLGGDNTNGNNTGLLAFATTGNPALTVSGNVQVGGDGNAVRTGTITFQNGSTLTAGSLTLGSALATPAPGIIVMTAGGTLIVGGAITVNTVAGNTWTPGAGTVQLTATSTLPTTIFTTFNNLQIANSAVVTFPSAKTISGNLSIGSGSSLNLGTFTHSAGTLTLNGQGTVNGSWGSTTSPATNKNNTFFAATTGIVNVTTSTCTPPAAPSVSSPVTYCVGAIATQLTATGANLLWYTTSSGGSGTSTAPTPSTATAGTTSYFVSQTVGCESPRAQLDVVVNPNPVSTVNGSTNITCNGAADGTITIQASGGTPPYSFSVNDGGLYQSSANNPYIYQGLSPNTPYKIRVKDNNGCQSQTF